MSFYKITDPKERRRMFEKLERTKKNIRDQFLQEKIGLIESSESVKKLFKPVTETQRVLSEDIKQELAPIRESLSNIESSQGLPIARVEEYIQGLPSEFSQEETERLGPVATEYINKYTKSDKEVDKIFGLYKDKEDGYNKIGNKRVEFEGDDIVIHGKRYVGTPGLWELIVKNEPYEIYDNNDFQTYAEILVKTDAMRRNNDPTEPHPKASRSKKWMNIVKPIWENRIKKGSAIKTLVLPSVPNALIERLDLLMASKQAGNTGTRNELVSICDELLRQKVINKNQYKNLMLRL